MKNKSPENNDLASRRKLLSKLAVALPVSGLAAIAPEKWVKPVIDSMLLPAHAETSDQPAD